MLVVSGWVIDSRSTFLRAHWEVFAASDLLTVEVWTGKGLATHYLLFVMSLADRVKVLGVTANRLGPAVR